jgi:uncharacterized SAM-binding protein YcdF (DUF218 family)
LFFIISKLLYFFLNPIVWVLTCLLIAIISKKPKRKKRFTGASLLIILIFGNSFFLDEVVRQYEIEAITLDTSDHYNYGVVLSGMTIWDNQLNRVNFHGNVDRLLQSLPIHENGIIDSLILSGGDGSAFQSEMKESVALVNYLNSINFNTTRVVLEPDSKNTYENALFTVQKMKTRGVNLQSKKVLLITSAIHMRRSLACFKKAGVSCTPYVTNRITGPRKFVFDHLFIPNSEAMHGWKALLHELIGFGAYSLMSYI